MNNKDPKYTDAMGNYSHTKNKIEYGKNHYDRFEVKVPLEKAAQFRKKLKEYNMPFSKIFHQAIDEFLSDDYIKR